MLAPGTAQRARLFGAARHAAIRGRASEHQSLAFPSGGRHPAAADRGRPSGSAVRTGRQDHPGLANAYLDCYVAVIEPAENSRPAYWIYHELWRLVTLLPLPLRYGILPGAAARADFPAAVMMESSCGVCTRAHSTSR